MKRRLRTLGIRRHTNVSNQEIVEAVRVIGVTVTTEFFEDILEAIILPKSKFLFGIKSIYNLVCIRLKWLDLLRIKSKK